MIQLATVLCIALAVLPGADGLRFASSFGSNMVLQQAPQQAGVWGWTTDPSAVTLELSTSEGDKPKPIVVKGSTTAVNSTAYLWQVTLPATEARKGPSGKAAAYSLVVKQGSASVDISNVLFGEVWVCSGQSNMAFLLELSMNGSALVQEANDYPEIRLFTAKKTTAVAPLLDFLAVEQSWSVGNNVSVSDGLSGAGLGAGLGVRDDNWLYMSAVCYLYGQKIHQALGVPVGLLNTNWGGTVIEQWSSSEALAQCPSADSDLRTGGKLFNAMISPLLNHTIAGVVWYQGESNEFNPVPYGCRQPALVADWRAKWHKASGGRTAANFPFGLVQLAGDTDSADSLAKVLIRQFQTGGSATVAPAGYLPNTLMPNTFMVPAYDLGDEDSPYGAVHIRYKTDVANRLAAAGLRQAYQKDLYTGPVFDKAVAGETSVTLQFRNAGAQGLALSPMNISTKNPMTNWAATTPFEVCTGNVTACGLFGRYDGWSQPKETSIGTDGSTVVLSGYDGTAVAVRYAWRCYPCQHLQCGLYSKAEALPPPPFHFMF